MKKTSLTARLLILIHRLIGGAQRQFGATGEFAAGRGMVRRLGGKAWRALHRLVYVVAPLALLHFFWMRAGKNDFAEVAVYAAIVAVLLLARIGRKILLKK